MFSKRLDAQKGWQKLAVVAGAKLWWQHSTSGTDLTHF